MRRFVPRSISYRRLSFSTIQVRNLAFGRMRAKQPRGSGHRIIPSNTFRRRLSLRLTWVPVRAGYHTASRGCETWPARCRASCGGRTNYGVCLALIHRSSQSAEDVAEQLDYSYSAIWAQLTAAFDSWSAIAGIPLPLRRFLEAEDRFDHAPIFGLFPPDHVAAEGSMPVAPVAPAVATSLLRVSIFPSKSQLETSLL